MPSTRMVAADRETAIARLRPELRLRALSAALSDPDTSGHEWAALQLLDLAADLAWTPEMAGTWWGRLLARQRAPLRDQALAVVGTRLAAFPESIRELALTLEVGAWTPILRRARASADSLAVRSVAQLAAHRVEYALVDRLALGLADADASAAQGAEAAIEVLALAANPAAEPDIVAALDHLESSRRLWGALPRRWDPPGTAEERAAFHALIADCVKDFERHRRRGVVLAAAVLLDRASSRSGPLAAWLAQQGVGTQSALRGVLRWSRLATVHCRAWEWLWREELAAAAGDRIAHARGVEEHEIVLSRSALAHRPARARHLASVLMPELAHDPKAEGGHGAEGPLPQASQVGALSRLARLGMPLLGACVRGDARRRHLAVEPLLQDEDVLVRHALVRRGPRRMLDDLCFDLDGRVGRSAFLRRTHAGGLAHASGAGDLKGPLRMARLLGRSPHEVLRSWAAQEGAELAPGGVRERVAERRRLVRDRAGVLDETRRRLVNADGQQRLLGATSVRRLGLAGELQPELWGVVRGALGDGPHTPEEARAAATAVAALGRAPDGESRRVVRECLHANDPRVRANAVEAVAAGEPARWANVLLEFKDDAHHRARANSLRLLILGGQGQPEPKGSTSAGAVESLMAMLSDEREMHRLAGVWAVGRLAGPRGRSALSVRWAELLARVMETARFDASQAVRRRAVLAAVLAQNDARTQVSLPGEGPWFPEAAV